MLLRLFAIFLFCALNAFAILPEGFVYLEDVDSTIQTSLRYNSRYNFVGRKINGYTSNRAIMTKEAAFALKKINEELKQDGFELVIYDAYRPQKAVDDFARWSKTPEDISKKLYYPSIEKEDIFKRGFVAYKSSHSRGSTVDITIIEEGRKVCNIKEEKRGKYIYLNDCTIDMGMHWDFFGKESHFQTNLVSAEYNAKRRYLNSKMLKYGFKVAQGEWWHFTLQEEPFPNKYCDF